MNRQPKPQVVSSVFGRRTVTAIATVLVLATTPGCVEIKGGAVELSWLLQDFDGQDVKCIDARVQTIRVCWVPIDRDAGETEARCAIVRRDAGIENLYRDFDCVEQRGVTRFELPPGENAVFVQPVCQGGQTPTGRVQVPPPIVRDVGSGEVVSLNQLLLVVEPDCEGSDCTCPP